MTDPGRRRAGRAAKEVPRLAVYQDVRLGAAELVPDIDRAGSWLLFLDGVPQSGVDLADPGYLEFEYVRRIGHVADLAFPPGQPLRALHLGGGALTLPRYLQHTRPGSRQLVAEVDDALTSLVRAHLPLPAGHRIRVRAADARAVAESARPGSFDLVIADVFAGAVTPPHLTTAEFAAAAARALRPGGVYAVNVASGPSRPAGTSRALAVRSSREGLDAARSAVATVRCVFKETVMVAESSVLRGRRRGNVVIFGSDQPLPEEALARAAACDPFPARVVADPDLARFASGAPVITDAALATGALATVPLTTAPLTTVPLATGAANTPASPGASPHPTEW